MSKFTNPINKIKAQFAEVVAAFREFDYDDMENSVRRLEKALLCEFSIDDDGVFAITMNTDDLIKNNPVVEIITGFVTDKCDKEVVDNYLEMLGKLSAKIDGLKDSSFKVKFK